MDFRTRRIVTEHCRRAKRRHGLGGVKHILSLQKAGNLRFPDGHRTQHQRPVGNRFIAGDANAALEASSLSRGERADVAFLHGPQLHEGEA